MDWQPIETAPKDGTQILAALDDEFPYIIVWREARRGTNDDDKGAGWRIDWDGYFLGKHEQPTHWMPLPKCP